MEEDASSSDDPASALPPPTRHVTYERTILYLGWEGDTALIVPWFLRAEPREDSVLRAAQAWLGRDGSWEPFLDAAWSTPALPSPWRLLPHGPMRLLVGPGDAIEGLLFEDEPRQLELVFGSPFIQWGGQRGETFRVLTGAVLIADQRLDGLLLDMTRVRALDDPEPGDWIFLTSGDSVVILLVDPGKRDPSANVFYSGWAQVSSEDVQWPAVVVEWPQVRSVDQARREVPDAWALTAVDADLSGNLSPVTSHVTVGEGEGPQLPIDALFEVRGDLQIGGRELPVRGLVRHVQH